MSNFMSFFNLWAHWLIAIAYREAALLLPLIMKPNQRRDKHESKTQKIKRRIHTTNVFYYACLVIYLLVNELYWIMPTSLIIIFDALAQFTPCIVLMHSVWYLKAVIDTLDQEESAKKFFANERLMIIHLTLFACSLVFLATEELLVYNGYGDG